MNNKGFFFQLLATTKKTIIINDHVCTSLLSKGRAFRSLADFAKLLFKEAAPNCTLTHTAYEDESLLYCHSFQCLLTLWVAKWHFNVFIYISLIMNEVEHIHKFRSHFIYLLWISCSYHLTSFIVFLPNLL